MLFLFCSEAYSGVCDNPNEPTSREDWVKSNICYFRNTVLVKIKSGYLREWYNPLTHFRVPNVFEYEVEVLDIYKGKAPSTSCMVESTEATFVISAGITNTRQIVSFDEDGKCIFIDIAAKQQSSSKLEVYAKQLAKQIENENNRE